MKRRETTYTHLVLSYLIQLDGFATAQQIREATKISVNRVSAALHELRKYKAIGVEDVNGLLYWFPSPDSDTRIREVLERVPEEPGSRKSRKLKEKK